MRLRPLELADASDLQRLAGDRDVAYNTRSIPHPYPDGYAERWIGDCQTESETDENGPDGGRFVGIIELLVEGGPPSQLAQLSYWIGKPYWNLGYATEAAKAIVEHGFTALGLDRVRASHFGRNQASGRVLQKIGMSHEGTLEQNVDKWGTLEDVVLYGMSKGDLADAE